MLSDSLKYRKVPTVHAGQDVKILNSGRDGDERKGSAKIKGIQRVW